MKDIKIQKPAEVPSKVEGSVAPSCVTIKCCKAIRPHVCVECNGTIGKGEQYIRTNGRWPGCNPPYAKFDVCLTCNGLRIAHELEHGPVPFGMLHTEIKRRAEHGEA